MEYEGHEPVLMEDVLAALNPRPGDHVADLTLGMGGHSRAILTRIQPDGLLYGLDADQEMLERASRVLAPFQESTELRPGFFDRADKVFGWDRPCLDGLLLDLGVSSVQLDEPRRGFSFSKDGPLDMRMDPTRGSSAADFLRREPEESLVRIFQEYGQERFARRVAKEIIRHRKVKRLARTGELADLVARVVPRGRQRIHPATRVFQALRIAVNDELGRIDRVLEKSQSWLKEGGRMVVISFHSLEDGRVKRFFRERYRVGGWELLTKKPLRPTFEETERNPRARSARMRAAIKGNQ